MLMWNGDKYVNIPQSSITPDLSAYATQQWVLDKKYLTSVPVASVVGQTGNITAAQVATALTDAGYKLTDTTYGLATTTSNGLMSATDKTKLDGIAANANNYTLPTASSDTKGGIKVGTTLSISGEVIDLKSGFPSGTYTKVQIDDYGRVSSGSILSASDIPSLPWSKITTGKPTTISGYGITDAYTKTETDNKVAALQSLLDSMFERVYDSNNKLIRVHSNVTISSSGDLVAGSNSEGGGTSGGAYTQLEWNAIKALTQSESGLLASAYSVKEAYNELNTAIETLAGKATNVTFTQTLTSGKQIGSISIDGKSTSLFAPANYAWSEVTGKPTFATVATSGSYTDLANKPTIASLMGSTAIGGTSSYLYWNGSAFVSKALGGNAFTSISKVSQLTNDSGYITGITKAMVESVLTGNITSHTHSYLPLSGGTMSNTNVVTNLNADLLDGYHADSFTKKLDLVTTDLNSIDDSLLGQQSGNANATTELHYPVEEAGGLISILSTYNSTNQIYGTYRTNRWFARGAGTGLSSRTSWREFAFLDSNVASASKWETPRTITLTGSVTGSVSIDGSANVTLATTLPARLSQYITDGLDDGNGFGRIASNSPFKTFVNHSYNDCMLVTTAYSDAWRGELALDYYSNNIAYRNKNNGTWNSWAMMLTTDNFSKYALPKSGGMINGTQTTPFNINTSATEEVGMRFLMSGSSKAWVGYTPNVGATLFVYSNHNLGLTDAGVGFLDSNTLIHSGNYNSYAPKLDGTGASGTWGINISGNAATATKLATSRTIWGQSFDGTGNVDSALTGVTDITASGNATVAGDVGCSNLILQYGGKIYNNGGKFGLYVSSTAGDYGSAIYLTHDHGSKQTAFRIHSRYDSALGGLSIGFSTTTQNYGASPIDATYADIIHIRGNGNVGIGTSSPAYKLDVNGTLRVTDATTLASTLNVSGRATIAGGITSKGLHDFLVYGDEFNFIPDSFSGVVGINTRTASSNLNGNVTEYLFRNGAGAYSDIRCKNLYATGGTLTIGSATMTWNDSALIFDKSTRFRSDTFLDNWAYLRTYLTDGTIHSLIGVNNSDRLFINDGTTIPTIIRGGNVGIGTNTPSYKLHVVGTAYATENIIAAGDLTAGSDIRYKDKIQDLRLSVHDIALAPAFTYKWNNREDDALVHIGSSAQYWLNTNARDAVYYDKQNDFYHLNYASLALCNTIILARGMETQEEKIARLEERIKELEDKLRQYGINR